MMNVRRLRRVWRRCGALSSSRWKLNNSWFFLECNPCMHCGRQTRKQCPFLLLQNVMHWRHRQASQVTETLRLFKRCFDLALPPPQHGGAHGILSWAAVASRWARRLMDNVQPCNKHKCVFCLSSERHPPPGPSYEYSRHYSPSAVPTKVPLTACKHYLYPVIFYTRGQTDLGSRIPPLSLRRKSCLVKNRFVAPRARLGAWCQLAVRAHNGPIQAKTP